MWMFVCSMDTMDLGMISSRHLRELLSMVLSWLSTALVASMGNGYF